MGQSLYKNGTEFYIDGVELEKDGLAELTSFPIYYLAMTSVSMCLSTGIWGVC